MVPAHIDRKTYNIISNLVIPPGLDIKSVEVSKREV